MNRHDDRSHPHRTVFLTVAFRCSITLALVCLSSSTASAWWFVEHAAIGAEGYAGACKRVGDELRENRVADEAPERTRYKIACSNLSTRSLLYGQANALAGDQFDNPDDFLDKGADWKVGSRRHYYRLQLVDVQHFHPASMREWLSHHQAALKLAATAHREMGLDATAAFQRAFYRSAFADHFLQDSYAPGHMGFNRSASSIGATAKYHNYWNRRGRRLRDRNGDSWVAYGDGQLNADRNKTGRERVIRASTHSAFALIHVFVFGVSDYDRELAMWRELPYLIDSIGTASLLGFDSFDEEEEASRLSELRPLDAVSRPARVDAVIDSTFHVLGTARKPRQTTLALLVGFDVALPIVDSRAHLSVGVSTPHDDRDARLVGKLELRRHLGLSVDGLITHLASVSAIVQAREDSFAGWALAGYMMQMEIGLHAVQLHVGPSYDFGVDDFGYYAGVGYGRILGFTGGGLR